jgi:flagellar biosynthesis protein FlhB
MDSFADKIHPPTPRRRQQAREEGRVARSHDLAASVLLLGAVGALFWLGRDLVHYLGVLTSQQLGGRAWLTTDSVTAVQWWHTTAQGLGHVLLPLLGLLAVLAVASHAGQFGFLFLPHKLAPDFQRLAPGNGVQRMFSAGNFVRLLFGLLKAATIAVVAGWSLWTQRERLIAMGSLAIQPLAALAGELLLSICLKVALALLALGLLDYGYQRWRLERDLRMTTQELREELKNEHGVPLVTQRRRQLRRQLAATSDRPGAS